MEKEGNYTDNPKLQIIDTKFLYNCFFYDEFRDIFIKYSNRLNSLVFD